MRRNWLWSLIFFMVAIKIVTHVILNLAGTLALLVGHMSSAVIVIAFFAYFFRGPRHHHRRHRETDDYEEDNYGGYNDFGGYDNGQYENYNSNNNYSQGNSQKQYNYNENTPEKRGQRAKSEENWDEGYHEEDEYSLRSRNIIFSSRNISADINAKEYNIVFGSGTIDFSRLPVPKANKKIKVDVVFSNGIININPNIPAVIRVSSVFSNTSLPNIGNVSFGKEIYTTPGYRKGEPHFYIVLDSVFSSVVVR